MGQPRRPDPDRGCRPAVRRAVGGGGRRLGSRSWHSEMPSTSRRRSPRPTRRGTWSTGSRAHPRQPTGSSRRRRCRASSLTERREASDRDQRRPRQGASRPHRRGDDGVQARAAGDRRRHRRRGHPAAGEGHGVRPGSAPIAPRPRARRRDRRRRRRHRSSASAARPSPSRRTTSSGRSPSACCAPCTTDGPDAAAALRAGAARADRQARREHRRRRSRTRFEGGTLAAYVHPPANKIGVLVQLDGGDEALARQLAMHISFGAPEWASRDDVPAETLAAERQIYLNSDEVQSKPEAAREKIVDGMLAKRFFAATPGGVLARPGLDPRLVEDGRPGARRRPARR